jgi:benzene/toluene/chlorobenzene dioxygenase ferredoxin component
MAFIYFCDAAQVPPDTSFRGESAVGPIAVFNLGGEFHAIEDTCSHGQWSLSDGYVDGDQVECSLHMGRFCIRTGKACSLPATAPVKVFPVQNRTDGIYVDPDAGRYAA